MTNTTLQQNTMKRVHRIYVMRRAWPWISKAMCLAVLFVALSALVSFKHIITNMPSLTELASLARFFVSAFANTELTVQLASLATAVLALFFCRDVIKNVVSSPILMRV